jgi:hypothetical protein
MSHYEQRMNALRHGELLPAGDESYDPNVDMRAHQSNHKRRHVNNESYLSREQLMELRKVQNERVEVGLFFHSLSDGSTLGVYIFLNRLVK